jgi:hypothetical protein
VSPPPWRERQRAALVTFSPWIGAAWGALAGMLLGAAVPWQLAQTFGALLGGVAGWRLGRAVSERRRS